MLIASKMNEEERRGLKGTTVHSDDCYSHKMAATTPTATAPSISTTEQPADIATRPEDKGKKRDKKNLRGR